MMEAKGKAPSASPQPPTPQSVTSQAVASASSSSSSRQKAALASTGVGLHASHGSYGSGGAAGAHASLAGAGSGKGGSGADGVSGWARPLLRKTFIGVTYVERLKKYRSCFFSPIEAKTIGTGTWPSPYEAARARHERVAELPPEMRVRVSDDFEYDEVDKDRPKPAELQGEDWERMAARARARASARDTKLAAKGAGSGAGPAPPSSGEAKGAGVAQGSVAGRSASGGKSGLVARQQPPQMQGPLLPLSADSEGEPGQVHARAGGGTGVPGAGAQVPLAAAPYTGAPQQSAPRAGIMSTPTRPSGAHVARIGTGGRSTPPASGNKVSIFDMPTPTHGHGPGGGPRIGQPPPRPVKKPRTAASMAATGAQPPPFRVWPGSAATPVPSGMGMGTGRGGQRAQGGQEASPVESSPALSATGQSYGTSVLQAAGALDLISRGHDAASGASGGRGEASLALPMPAHAALTAGPSAWSRALVQQPQLSLPAARGQLKRGRDDAPAPVHAQPAGRPMPSASASASAGAGDRASAPTGHPGKGPGPAHAPSHSLALTVPPVGPVFHGPSSAQNSPRPGLHGLPVHSSMHPDGGGSALYAVGPGPLTELLHGGSGRHMWVGTPPRHGAGDAMGTSSIQRPQQIVVVNPYGPYFPPMTLPSPQGIMSFVQPASQYAHPLPVASHNYGHAAGQHTAPGGVRTGAGTFDGSNGGIEMPAGGLTLPTVSGPLPVPLTTSHTLHHPTLDLPSLHDLPPMPGGEDTGEVGDMSMPVPIPVPAVLRGMGGSAARLSGNGRVTPKGSQHAGQGELHGPKPVLVHSERVQGPLAPLSSGSGANSLLPRNDSFILPQR